MRVLMPAFGLGRTERPYTTGGLGFFRLSSALGSDIYVSEEGVIQVWTTVELDLISREEVAALLTEAEAILVSAEPVADLATEADATFTTEQADNVVSEGPPANLESEEP